MFTLLKTIARLVFLLIPPAVIGALIYFLGSPGPLFHSIGTKLPMWAFWTGLVIWILFFLKIFKDEPDTIDALGRIFWLALLGFFMWHAWQGHKSARVPEEKKEQAPVTLKRTGPTSRPRSPGRMM